MKPVRAAAFATSSLVLILIASSLVAFPDGVLKAQAFAAAPLSEPELQNRLQAQGFSNVQNLRHEGNRVVVTATKDGQTGELVVDPSTGKPLQNAERDDGDGDD